MAGSITYRLISERESSEGVQDFSPSTRDLENFVQLEGQIYYVATTGGEDVTGEKKPQTAVSCTYTEGGAYLDATCTGCPIVTYTRDEYAISDEGRLLILDTNQTLSYEEYELRKEGEIMTCYETVNGNLEETGKDMENSEL